MDFTELVPLTKKRKCVATRHYRCISNWDSDCEFMFD